MESYSTQQQTPLVGATQDEEQTLYGFDMQQLEGRLPFVVQAENPIGIQLQQLTDSVPWISPLSSAKKEEEEENQLFDLGRNIKAEPCIYEGAVRVDLRHWNQDGTRTRKGISLPVQCWYAVVNGRQHIENAVNQMKEKQTVDKSFHLGNLIYIHIKSPLWLVDIRYWYKAEDGSMLPGRRGISLKFPEFNKLMKHAEDIRKKLEAIPHENNV